MGYTHYWRVNSVRGKSAEIETVYRRAIQDCQRVAHAYNRACAAKGDTDARLSGYTAHAKVGSYGGLNLNGKGDLAHESFTFREHFNENEAFNFCKTARKPYDIVVTACLAILKHRLGDAIEVSSDGDASDWSAGVKLARKVTGLKLANPIPKRAKVAA